MVPPFGALLLIVFSIADMGKLCRGRRSYQWYNRGKKTKGGVQGMNDLYKCALIGSYLRAVMDDPCALLQVAVTEVLEGGKFYVQAVADQKVAAIQKQLSSLSLQEAPLIGAFNPKKGDVVLAQFSADKSWNRAMVSAMHYFCIAMWYLALLKYTWILYAIVS